jgi:hypothetical protein
MKREEWLCELIGNEARALEFDTGDAEVRHGRSEAHVVGVEVGELEVDSRA